MSTTVLQPAVTSDGKVIVQEQTPEGRIVGLPIAPLPPDAAMALAGALILAATRAAGAGSRELGACLDALEATGALDELAQAVPFDL